MPGHTDWDEINRIILDKLDIEKEYRNLDVQFTAARPSPSGWLACWAKDRPRGNAPSAAVNVGNGPARGRYCDRGGENLTLSLWDFAARFGGYGDWENARKHFAMIANVALPRAKVPIRPEDQLAWWDWDDGVATIYCDKKKGPSLQSLKMASTVLGAYHRKTTAAKRQRVFAMPAYNGPHWTHADPSAWVIFRTDTEPIEVYNGPDKPTEKRKVMSVKGSVGGLLNRYAVEVLTRSELRARVEVVWKVEGVPDMLTLQATIPPDLWPKHLVISNSQGAGETVKEEWVKLLTGLPCYLVGDADMPGQIGIRKWEVALSGNAREVRNIRLPYAIEMSHGPDLRDYVNEGHTYDDLLTLAKATTPVTEAIPVELAYATSSSTSSTSVTSSIDWNDGLTIDPNAPAATPPGNQSGNASLAGAGTGAGTGTGAGGVNSTGSAVGGSSPTGTAGNSVAGTSGGSGGSSGSGGANTGPGMPAGMPGGTPGGTGNFVIADAMMVNSLAILKTIQIEVLGYYEDRSIDVYSSFVDRRQVFKIDKIARLSFTELLMIGGKPIAEHVRDSKEVLPPSIPMQQVRDAISIVAGAKTLANVTPLGQGVWDYGPHCKLLVNGSAGMSLNGQPKFNDLASPLTNDRRILDLGGHPWFDAPKIESYMREAQTPGWSAGIIQEYRDLMQHWLWKQANDIDLTASLLACSWVQTLWPWRPLISLTGSSDCGKTSLVKMLSTTFSRLGMYFGKPTEAGLRQAIRNRACVVFIDEFENDASRSKIYEMLRMSSQGGSIYRGTADQKGREYPIRHMVWMAAIESGLNREADKNRFVELELHDLPKGHRGVLPIPDDDALREMGAKLFAVALHHYDRALELFTYLKSRVIDGVHGRLVESYSVPASMYAAIHGMDEADAEVTLRRFLHGRGKEAGDVVESDSQELVRTVLESHVKIGNNERCVSEVMCDPNLYVEWHRALERRGLMLTTPGKMGRASYAAPKTHIFFSTKIIQRFVLTQTRFRDLDCEMLLRRFPGANKIQRMMSGKRTWGIEIPTSAVPIHIRTAGEPDPEELPYVIEEMVPDTEIPAGGLTRQQQQAATPPAASPAASPAVAGSQRMVSPPAALAITPVMQAVAAAMAASTVGPSHRGNGNPIAQTASTTGLSQALAEPPHPMGRVSLPSTPSQLPSPSQSQSSQSPSIILPPSSASSPPALLPVSSPTPPPTPPPSSPSFPTGPPHQTGSPAASREPGDDDPEEMDSGSSSDPPGSVQYDDEVPF